MQTIVNLGTGGADLNGQNGSTASADSNDALFLDWPGDNAGNYVYLPGATNNFLRVPDEAALDITGDMTIICRMESDSWDSAVIRSLLSKNQASGNESYRWFLNSNETMQFQRTVAGSPVNYVSTASIPTDQTELWLRVDFDLDNGSSQSQATFSTSVDGVTFTQLGSVVTDANTTATDVSTAIVEVGTVRNGGLQHFAGKVYRAQVYDGVEGAGGSLVLDIDTSVISSGSDTSFTALTGQTVTINRGTSGRKSVAVVSRVWLFGTDDYMEVADNALLNFGANDDATILVFARTYATPINQQRYAAKENVGSALGWTLRNESTVFAIRAVAADGNFFQDIGTTVTAGNLVCYGLRIDRTLNELAAISDGILSLSPTNIASAGSFANSEKMTIARRTDSSSNYADAEIFAIAVFRRSLSQSEISAISTYYQNKAA